MMLMMQVEKRFGNASHWVEALQLVDISGGIVDANVLVRAAAALLVVIKFRSTSRADESSVHEMLVIASSMSARAISMEDVCQEEMSLLTAMDFEIDLPTPVAWFRMFLVRFDILTEQAFCIQGRREVSGGWRQWRVRASEINPSMKHVTSFSSACCTQRSWRNTHCVTA